MRARISGVVWMSAPSPGPPVSTTSIVKLFNNDIIRIVTSL